MKHILLTVFMLLSISALAGKKTIKVSSDAGSHIFVDGSDMGTNAATVRVEKNSSINVKVVMEGFITAERNYVNDGKQVLPKTDYIKLSADDAYQNSFITNVANQDVDVASGYSEDNAWPIASRIITGAFDVLQVTDKNTGYICTAWVAKNFKSATVRSRLILKTVSSKPLQYKIKLISEIAPPGTAANVDEAFKPWDRVLRNFENLLAEFQSRLAKG